MSSENEKKDFMKKVTILIDTREQKNSHIITIFDNLGIMHESRKLDYGDYSFAVEGRDFSRSCVIERKANIDELYGNLTHDRERIEKEFDTISKNANQCTLLLENCSGGGGAESGQGRTQGAEYRRDCLQYAPVMALW